MENFHFDSILPYFFASILLIIGYFAIKYPDRAAGTRDLKGPKGFPIIGNLITTLRKIETFNDYLLEQTKKYGDIYTLTLPGPIRMIIINIPELLEYILKDNYLNYPKGPYYSQLSSDLFGYGIFNTTMEIPKKNYKPAAENGESIDLTNLFFRFTMDTFVKICFNENLGTLTDLENTPLF
ncbi:12485_t:CDS:2, partial [Ambispora gerdemannii]